MHIISITTNVYTYCYIIICFITKRMKQWRLYMRFTTLIYCFLTVGRG